MRTSETDFLSFPPSRDPYKFEEYSKQIMREIAERRAATEAKKLEIMRLMQENRRSREDSVLKGDVNEQSKNFDLVESASARLAESGELSARSDLISDDSEDDDFVPHSEDCSSDEDDDSEEDYNKEDDNYDDHNTGFGDPQQQHIVVRETENGLLGDEDTTEKPFRLFRLEAETPSPSSDVHMQKQEQLPVHDTTSESRSASPPE